MGRCSKWEIYSAITITLISRGNHLGRGANHNVSKSSVGGLMDLINVVALDCVFNIVHHFSAIANFVV